MEDVASGTTCHAGYLIPGAVILKARRRVTLTVTVTDFYSVFEWRRWPNVRLPWVQGLADSEFGRSGPRTSGAAGVSG